MNSTNLGRRIPVIQQWAHEADTDVKATLKTLGQDFASATQLQVLDGAIGQELLDLGQTKRLRGLCWLDAGSRNFYTVNTPIRTPADLQGLKIRVQNSPVSIAMVRQLGAAPTPIDFGELYTALAQGVVDGAENNPPSFFLSRHYEVARYYTLDEHTSIPDVLIVSTKVWDTLSEQERAWLQQAARESAEHQAVLWAEAEEESLVAVQEAGVEIIRPDKEPFRREVQPLLESFRAQPALYDLIQQIQTTEP